jgi:3-methyladenine DNA glycosylase AlkC
MSEAQSEAVRMLASEQRAESRSEWNKMSEARSEAARMLASEGTSVEVPRSIDNAALLDDEQSAPRRANKRARAKHEAR